MTKAHFLLSVTLTYGKGHTVNEYISVQILKQYCFGTIDFYKELKANLNEYQLPGLMDIQITNVQPIVFTTE